MSQFPNKQFKGVLYTFQHLAPFNVSVNLTPPVPMTVKFGSHCFTEAFDSTIHIDHHKYSYNNEIRAFDLERYTCSLILPALVQSMLSGMIYDAKESYTYVAKISILGAGGTTDYSIFFSLKKDNQKPHPALIMFIKSAYLKSLMSSKNAKNWRFPSLAGQIAGVFPPPVKKPKPQKKKTP